MPIDPVLWLLRQYSRFVPQLTLFDTRMQRCLVWLLLVVVIARRRP